MADQTILQLVIAAVMAYHVGDAVTVQVIASVLRAVGYTLVIADWLTDGDNGVSSNGCRRET